MHTWLFCLHCSHKNIDYKPKRSLLCLILQNMSIYTVFSLLHSVHTLKTTVAYIFISFYSACCALTHVLTNHLLNRNSKPRGNALYMSFQTCYIDSICITAGRRKKNNFQLLVEAMFLIDKETCTSLASRRAYWWLWLLTVS